MSSGPIKVGIDMTFPNRNQAGSGVYARSLLASLQERSDVTAHALAGPARSGIAGTLRWMLRGASREVTASGVSLLHCPTYVTPWNVPVPVVVTVHDIATRLFPQDYPAEWRIYERRLLPGQARKAALVIAVSENTRRDVIGAYGIDPDRAITIHQGIDPRFANARAAGASERPTILFPGAPIGRKNLDVVLRALASAPARSALAGAMLQISGATAAQFPMHAATIATLGLGARVRWLGQVPRDEVPSLFAGASAVVYPSLYEGFGLPPLEAMAAGTPVVASNASCLPEVLDDAAVLLDPHDHAGFARALEEVLTSPEARKRLVAAGRERARKFTWERAAEQTVAAYRRVLERAG